MTAPMTNGWVRKVRRTERPRPVSEVSRIATALGWMISTCNSIAGAAHSAPPSTYAAMGRPRLPALT